MENLRHSLTENVSLIHLRVVLWAEKLNFMPHCNRAVFGQDLRTVVWFAFLVWY
jgi:hypothetical protein